MSRKTVEFTQETFCPIKQTINLLGKRWTILIMKEIHYSTGKRLGFMDLRRRLPEISTKVLSQRLKEMAEEGFVKRSATSNGRQVKVRYILTKKGEDACKIIEAFRDFGLKWGGKKARRCSKIDCELCAKDKEEELARMKNAPPPAPF